jgi:hypothetical protein
VISVGLARELRAAGLRWSPANGDRFVVAERGMDDEVFVLSDMTVELHQFASGPVIGFNGTTEWALDSLDQEDALWLPAEHQLRDLLGAAFRRLERSADGYSVVLRDGTDSAAGETRVAGPNPAEAYGRALLARLSAVTIQP